MRTFLIIWGGELISMIGSGLTNFALGVWIFEKTGQTMPYVLAMLFTTLPRMLVMPLAGMLADRWKRRWLMILGDTGSALATLAALLLVTAGRLEVGWIYGLVALSAACSTFQEPAYRASIPMLVNKKELARVSGLMNISEALQTLAAPLLAGFLYTLIGLRGIMTIDFATFFFAVGALLVVRVPQPDLSAEDRPEKPSLRRDMAFAWRYLWARPGLFWLIWFYAFVNLLVNFAAVLTGPLVLSFADASVYGMVEMTVGAGMLFGGLVISAWGGPRRRAAGVFGFMSAAALGLMLAGLRPAAWSIGAGFFLMLTFFVFSGACATAITQTKIAPQVQGRTIGLRGLITTSLMPAGYLLSGLLADRVFGPLMQPGGALAGSVLGLWVGEGPGRGIRLIFFLCGLLLLLLNAAAWANPRIRRIEQELPDQLPDRPVGAGAQPSPESGD
jgi:MFS family permease